MDSQFSVKALEVQPIASFSSKKPSDLSTEAILAAWKATKQHWTMQLSELEGKVASTVTASPKHSVARNYEPSLMVFI